MAAANYEDADMNIDFDARLERTNTQSVKFDKRDVVFGNKDVIPLWVADTDFAVPECVTVALRERINHPIYGYSAYPQSLKNAVIGWFKRKHQVDIDPQWLVIAPGVMTSVAAFVQAVTSENEGVIVQPPVYHVFFPAVTHNSRKLVLNPLVKTPTGYDMNLPELNELAAAGARALIFCSPHNPVGRVWSKEELVSLMDISRRHKMNIVSDDIHCDLTYEGERHQFLFELATEDDLLVTTIAPNKTFNIPALGLSALIIKNPTLRKQLQKVFDQLLLGGVNPLSAAAMEAVYAGEADDWHSQLMTYLQVNRDFVHHFFAERDLGIKANCPQATFLSWLDCRDLGMTDAQLKQFFVEECGLGLSPGASFGLGGEGFMRINLGTRTEVLQDALHRIENAIKLRFHRP